MSFAGQTNQNARRQFILLRALVNTPSRKTSPASAWQYCFKLAGGT